MYRALLERNSEYDGLFFVGVKTTGIFCRCTCSAKKPLQKNVVFFTHARDAIASGYRACKRCRPLEAAGRMPEWLEEIVGAVDRDPLRRWTDADFESLGVDPTRIRRWFKANHGITFHSYLRSRRLANALAQLSVGDDAARVALDAGYESLSAFRDAFQKWLGATPGKTSDAQRVLTVNRIPSPLGPLIAAADDDQLFLVEFADRRMLQTQFQRLSKRAGAIFRPGDNRLIDQTTEQLDEYFTGVRRQFTLPLALSGTEFQQSVWRRLVKIDYGRTLSYEQLAREIDRPGAQRAVGRANGDNRLAIVVPCHRVVRSDGSLCGYGGGLRRKEWMLVHERANAAS
jgi:AraC family transcriptional regulator of adaptative response/methylated-DNA-[protein]-cysteine methyltransferase